MKRVVIVGAGVTGLSAAYNLQEKLRQNGEQVDYLLVEKDHLGGKIISEKVEGFLIEGGPDCFVSDKPAVLQLSSRLNIKDRLLTSNDENKGTFVLSGGKLHKLPEGLMLMVPTKILPFALSPLISWPGKLRMGLDLILPKKEGDFDETLASFVNRRLGREALDKIAAPLIGGIHGGDPETMSLKASFPRFLLMEQNYGSMIRAMLAARAKTPSVKAPSAQVTSGGKPEYSYFMSFVNGMEELVETLGNQLDQSKIILGKQVTKIEKRTGPEGKQGYTVYISGMDPVEADGVILAVPASSAAELMENLDAVTAENLRGIPMGSSANISLVYRREDLPFKLNTFGFVIPAIEQRKINAVTYTSVKWDYRVPNDQYVLLRTFVGGAKNQDLASLDDEALIGLVRREFNEILGITAEPVLFKIHRWLKARPQYTMGHLERMATIEARLDQYPGLYVAGGSFRGIGVPDCISDGLSASEKVMNYLHG